MVDGAVQLDDGREGDKMIQPSVQSEAGVESCSSTEGRGGKSNQSNVGGVSVAIIVSSTTF